MIDEIAYARLESQIGTVWVASTEAGLCKVSLGGRSGAFFSWLSQHMGSLEPQEEPEAMAFAVSQLREYFSGSRQAFDLPLDVRGTAFQRSVWSQVVRIPYGTTATYGDIAQLVGKPKASRAVGGAVGANPLPIVIPCHRVIGAEGILTGFGAGLDTKEMLLRLEGAYPL
ncbi:MAG: methylated-DNA--[protein]-cysteine S-methyltransferase [Anaerolineae bacterium]|nr:methylated-DNA--[protein]-cysteine S-methyltransferase [Anaerolineae bacterium]